MRNDLGGLTDAEKLAEEACVVEVELGLLTTRLLKFR
jgi:hypothetical protein